MQPSSLPSCTSKRPSLARLRHIGLSLLGDHGPEHLMLGLSIHDLIHAGWLGFIEAVKRTPQARTETYYYTCARYAMLTEMRSWYGASRYRNGHKHEWIKPTFVFLTGSFPIHESEMPFQLSENEVEDFKAFCYRLLSPASAELMIGLVIEGESIELLAERQGRTRTAAVIARAQAVRKLIDAAA